MMALGACFVIGYTLGFFVHAWLSGVRCWQDGKVEENG
jgi:hypothetical protein